MKRQIHKASSMFEWRPGQAAGAFAGTGPQLLERYF